MSKKKKSCKCKECKNYKDCKKKKKAIQPKNCIAKRLDSLNNNNT